MPDTMPNLMLEQVILAGRYAKAENSSGLWLYDPGPDGRVAIFKVWGLYNTWSYPTIEALHKYGPKRGWHHLPGCDCDFCNE